jgi:O-acetylserine/cysteine efflux transporter
MSPRDLAIIVGVLLIWGLNFVVAKIGLEQLPPIFFIALRFALVAVVLVPFVKVPRAHLGGIALLSTALGLLHFSFMFTGLAGIDASTAAITIQLQVPFAALLAAIFFGDRFGWRRTLGMLLAFGGVVLIAGEPRLTGNLGHLFMIVGGAFMWAVASIIIKKLGHVDLLPLNGWMALFATPQLALASLLLEGDQWRALAGSDWRVYGALAYQAFGVVIVGYSIWYRMLARYDVNVVMPMTLLLPVIGVAGAVALLGETLTWPMVFGGVATIIGVGIITLRQPRLTEPEPAAGGAWEEDAAEEPAGEAPPRGDGS